MQQKPCHLTVTHYHRKRISHHFSIERLFDAIRANMPSSVDCRIAVAPFVSQGIWRRCLNVLLAPFCQGEVNHITGDVHYLAYMLRKKKTVLTIHDCGRVETLRGIRKSLLLFFWFRLPEKRSSLITVISESARSELLRYLNCDPEKIRVIHDCISDDFVFSPKAFNGEKPVILHVGTKENKNLPRLAAALHGITCHLRIIGRLDERQISMLSENGIEYSSVADISGAEIVREYERSDMLAFVSTYEGFGLPILEANAVGRPVITGNILSMPEVSGKAACLVDPYRIEDIRAGILRVIDDDAYREQLIAYGRENVKRFSARTIAKQYALLYEELYLAGRT
ncbi:MAG: hypothetical protein A2X58_05795 [Nitrospirae bacterium GWC2_56_14]|nr:MAG: hypothetical protein A2X58_05795 [Nitrospirae bacterium GWC2_56_14]